MPKDYQEINKVIEEIGIATYGGQSFEPTGMYREKLTNILTTYGNAREMEGVEKRLTTEMGNNFVRKCNEAGENAERERIVQIIESLKIEGDNQFSGDKREDIADYLNDWLMPEIKRNLIEAIKK